MDKTWTVVEFRDSQTVEAVPTSWLIGQKCYWPAVARDKILAEIKRNVLPNTSWPLYEVRIFKDATYDDYLVARSKAKKAEDTSDLNSDFEKRNQIPSKKFASSSSDSDSDTVLEAPPKLSKFVAEPPKISNRQETENGDDLTRTPDLKKKSEDRVFLTFPQLNYSDIYTFSLVQQSLVTDKDNKKDCSCCYQHQQRLENFLLEILKKQTLIRAQLLQIQEDIPKMCVKTNEGHENFLRKFNFPLNDEESLNLVEEYLHDELNLKLAVEDLKKIGGKDLYDFLRRCLTNVITNSLAANFSYFGAKSKKAFRTLKLADLLQEAAIQYIDCDHKAVEQAIQKWLRRAKERDSKRQ